ncbi:MAG: ABC transporter substrate-binding protein [Alphaproteobacteria bacterium]
MAVAGALALVAPTAMAADFAKEWADLVAAAKKEGVVSIAAGGSPSRNYQDVFEAFKKKYGIRVEVSRGGANSTISRVLAERKTGKYTMDVALISVRINNQRLVPSESLIPFEPLLIHPEVVDKSKWYGGRYWYGDKFTKFTFFYTAGVIDGLRFWYNTKKVDAKDIATIKSPEDLLEPKWKGKIAAQAMEDPSGIRQMIDSWQTEGMGPDWVRKFLTEAGVNFSADRRIIETWLVGGRFPIKAPTGAEEELRTLAKKGIPIKEGVIPARTGMLRASGSGCCISAFKNAPHPNAAKLFINWFLTKEGQTLVHTTIPNLSVSSLRNDVPFGQVIEEQRRVPGKKYLYPDADPESGARNKKIQEEIMKIWESRKR